MNYEARLKLAGFCLAVAGVVVILILNALGFYR